MGIRRTCSILLFEDIDSVGLGRDILRGDFAKQAAIQGDLNKVMELATTHSNFSGLLNALDGMSVCNAHHHDNQPHQ